MNGIVDNESMNDLASRIVVEEQITKALPGLKKDQRVALFIDYNNFEYMLKDLGVSVNMRELRRVFEDRCQLIDSRIYWAFDYENTICQNKNVQLQKDGYTVTHKDLVTSHLGVKKGNMDAELVLDASDLPESIEHVVLFSGDQDFLPLINKLRKKFKMVSVCSTRKLSVPVIRHEVIRAASNFYEIVDLLPKIRQDYVRRGEDV